MKISSIVITFWALGLYFCSCQTSVSTDPSQAENAEQNPMEWIQSQCIQEVQSYDLSSISIDQLNEIDSAYYWNNMNGFLMDIPGDTIKIKNNRWSTFYFYDYREYDYYYFYSVIKHDEENRCNHLIFVTASKDDNTLLSVIYAGSTSYSQAGWYFYESLGSYKSPNQFLFTNKDITDEAGSEHPPPDAIEGFITITTQFRYELDEHGFFSRTLIKSDTLIEPYGKP